MFYTCLTQIQYYTSSQVFVIFWGYVCATGTRLKLKTLHVSFDAAGVRAHGISELEIQAMLFLVFGKFGLHRFLHNLLKKKERQ